MFIDAMDTRLAYLKLSPAALLSLAQRGFSSVEDLADLPTREILRISNVSGRDWLKLARALGRDTQDRP